MTGARAAVVGLTLLLAARTAIADPVGPSPPTPPRSTPAPAAPTGPTPPTGPAAPTGPLPPTGPAAPTGPGAPAAPTPPAGTASDASATAPTPQPSQQQVVFHVGLPQPSTKRISPEIGIGVALVYVSIPFVLIGGGTLAVGYLVDSTPVQVTGWVLTGASVATFAVGLGLLVSGSEQGPQPQTAAVPSPRVGSERPQTMARDATPPAITFPVLAGAF